MKDLFQLFTSIYTFVPCVFLLRPDEKIIFESICQERLKDTGGKKTTGACEPDDLEVNFKSCTSH